MTTSYAIYIKGIRIDIKKTLEKYGNESKDNIIAYLSSIGIDYDFSDTEWKNKFILVNRSYDSTGDDNRDYGLYYLERYQNVGGIDKLSIDQIMEIDEFFCDYEEENKDELLKSFQPYKDKFVYDDYGIYSDYFDMDRRTNLMS